MRNATAGLAASNERPVSFFMLRQRLIVTLLLIPPGIFFIFQGGFLYFGLLLCFFLPAAHEYAQIMRRGGYRPAQWLIVGGTFLLLLAQSAPTLWPALEPEAAVLSGGALAILLVAATAWHLVDFERGAQASGADWAITVAGMIYLGWMGGYFMLVRALPAGLSWTMTILPAIWFSDSGAYTVGSRLGKHHMSPRLSPKKTWEGFIGGILWGVFFGALFGALGSFRAGPDSAVGFRSGAVIGLFVSLVGTLGDLGISMLKRQVGVKDSSNLLGAHGGLLDRIDSWIVAVPLSYFLILLFFQ
ncbi:MAG: CDP-archaeol synthase [Chloroflexi bacterium]|nr:CDP-archaeol synthase [Chloroflexota bacterium]